MVDVETYNFQHFKREHLLFDLKQTLLRHGVQPGALSPDFKLPRVGGGEVQLSTLRDKPVLLHFGNYT